MDSDVNIEKDILNLNEEDLESSELLRQSINNPITKAVKKSARRKKLRERNHECNFCHEKYPSLRTLNQHLKSHGPNPFTCTQCPSTFKMRKYLTRHVTNIHTDCKKIKCDVCGRMFRWQNKLRDHMRIHTGEKPYKCEVCGKSFTAQYSLQGHMYLHTDEKPYKCSFCEYACRDNSTLRKHQNRHLGLEQVFECQICNKKMKNKFYLKEHITIKHLNVNNKQLLCDICGRSFTMKSNLAKHIRIIHDKITNAVHCHICDKLISNPQNLKNHMRVHTDVKPFKCLFEGCGKRFKDKSTQKKHSLIHFPPQHKCVDCGRGFTRRCRLDRHIKVVHGRRKCVECDYCGDRFYSKNYLIKHIRFKHMKRPKLECDECGYKTKTKPAMAKHLKSHYLRYEKKVRRKSKYERVELSNDLKIKEELLSDTEAYNIEDLLDIEKHDIEDEKDEEKLPDNLTQAKDMLQRNGTIPNNVFEQLFTQHINRDLEKDATTFDGTMDIHAEELCRGEIEKLLGKTTEPQLKETRKLMNPRYSLVRIDPDTIKDKIITNKRTTITNNIVKNVTIVNNDNDQNELSGDKIVGDERRVKKKKKKKSKEKKEKKKEEGGSLKLKLDVQQCYVCFKVFKTKEDLTKHCQQHFDVCSEKMLKKCPYCDFVTKYNITRHIKLVHKVNIKVKYSKIIDKKTCDNGSRYTMPINDDKVKEIEIIPSIKNLNKIASMQLDRDNREAKDKGVSKRKLVKHGKEWMVVQESVADGYELPKMTENELKSAGVDDNDNHVQRLKKLYQYNKKNGVAMLFPCDDCDKICQTLSALTLHKRRHDPNKKPFKKKIWKHKLTEKELVALEKSKNKKKIVKTNNDKPQPIVNKHKCDPKLQEFYKNNIRGSDIEFWQFLKIFNRMGRENVNEFEELEKRHDFGIHRKQDKNENEVVKKVKTKLRKRAFLSLKEIRKREAIKRRLREEIGKQAV